MQYTVLFRNCVAEYNIIEIIYRMGWDCRIEKDKVIVTIEEKSEQELFEFIFWEMI